MKQSKAASLLGLAMKAGKVASGEFSTEKALKSGMAYLVLLSGDASENTKKKFRNMAQWRNVPVEEFLNKSDLGRMIGRGERSVLAIVDEGFASGILKKIREERD